MATMKHQASRSQQTLSHKEWINSFSQSLYILITKTSRSNQCKNIKSPNAVQTRKYDERPINPTSSLPLPLHSSPPPRQNSSRPIQPTPLSPFSCSCQSQSNSRLQSTQLIRAGLFREDLVRVGRTGSTLTGDVSAVRERDTLVSFDPFAPPSGGAAAVDCWGEKRRGKC